MLYESFTKMTTKEITNRYWDLITFGLTYDKEELKSKARGIFPIRYGNYDYDIFNFTFLNDILSQSLEALYNGYIPYIDLDHSLLTVPDANNWNFWFCQPYEGEIDYSKYEWIIPKKKGILPRIWIPTYRTPFSRTDYELTCKLYRDWVIIKDDIFEYIAKEYQNLIWNKSVLGVLYRGTDLVYRQPKGHPIQPGIDDIINEIHTQLKALSCDYIYLATEEENVVTRFQTEFPGKILINKRQFVGNKFQESLKGNPNSLISSVFPSSKEQRIAFGKEYLSSIVLLSSCKGLIAGNCGGSGAALYLNDHQYEFYKIFDLGEY